MSSDNDPMPSVKIDVGFKAEVTAKIPEQSAGRLVDAITDLIRPLSEWTGLQADRIRLRREDVLLEITQKAQRRLALECHETTPVPLKFLIPYLENASNEEPTSELLDWWTSLLVSAASGGSQNPVLVDMMSKITWREATFLESLWRQGPPPKRITSAEVVQEFFTGIRTAGIYGDFGKMDGGAYAKAIEQACLDQCGRVKRIGIFPRFMQFPTHTHDGGQVRFAPEEDDIFDFCIAAGVLERIRVSFSVPSPFISVALASIDCVVFTKVGFDLMEAVQGGKSVGDNR